MMNSPMGLMQSESENTTDHVSVFFGDSLKSLQDWNVDSTLRKKFKHLLVESASGHVVAATKADNLLELFSEYQSRLANVSNVDARKPDPDDFYTTPTWPRTLGLEDNSRSQRLR